MIDRDWHLRQGADKYLFVGLCCETDIMKCKKCFLTTHKRTYIFAATLEK